MRAAGQRARPRGPNSPGAAAGTQLAWRGALRGSVGLCGALRGSAGFCRALRGSAGLSGALRALRAGIELFHLLSWRCGQSRARGRCSGLRAPTAPPQPTARPIPIPIPGTRGVTGAPRGPQGTLQGPPGLRAGISEGSRLQALPGGQSPARPSLCVWGVLRLFLYSAVKMGGGGCCRCHGGEVTI